jgi:hypothetical protein
VAAGFLPEVDFLAAVFLAGADLLAAVFLAGADLLAAVFLAGADLLAAVFLAGADFLAVAFAGLFADVLEAVCPGAGFLDVDAVTVLLEGDFLGAALLR